MLARRGVAAEQIEAEVKAAAAGILNRSRAMRRNALALKQLAERFSPAEMERLAPAKREEWRGLIRSKAALVAADARSLAAQLSGVLPGNAVSGDAGADVKDAGEAARAAQRLFGLAAAADSQIGQSFSVSGGSVAPVRSVQFWRELGQISAIAADLQKF